MVVKFNPKDVPVCLELMRELYASGSMDGSLDEDFWVKSWTGFVESGSGLLLGFIDEHTLASIMGALSYKDVNTGELRAGIMTAYTRLGFTRRGHGKALLKTYMGWAESIGCARIYAEHFVCRENHPYITKTFRDAGFGLHAETFTKEL